MNNNFLIRLNDDKIIRFYTYGSDAPITASAFIEALPFAGMFYHARISGQEIWNDRAPQLNIAQENASVFAEPGEVVISPVAPARNKTAGFMGIFYGEGKLLDCGNIFARVYAEDMPLLKQLGESIWKEGGQELRFERLIES